MEQLTLSFEPGISKRYQSLLECVTTCVYRSGHGKVAGKVDLAPSNLTAVLSGSKNRKFGVDHLEKYLDEFQDLEPVFYLVDKYLHNASAKTKAEALAEVNQLTAQLRIAIQRMEE